MTIPGSDMAIISKYRSKRCSKLWCLCKDVKKVSANKSILKVAAAAILLLKEMITVVDCVRFLCKFKKVRFN